VTAVPAILAAVVVVLLAALVAALAVVRRQRRLVAGLDARVEALEADLDAALRPRPATTTTERAVRRVVQTATQTASTVRERGLAGLVQRSFDDLVAWASTERAEVVSLAAADGTVTLMFSDIEGSTSLNAELGDASWVRVLRAHDDVVRSRVERYRGQVVKTAGDGFMVAFRDAEAACRAGVGIQRDLRRTLDPRLRVVAPVRVRIGIHTGEVVARDGDYFGRNVATAARVADLATGGEVLATDAVREALDDDAAVDLAEMGPVELKGLPGTTVVWRVSRR